MLRSVNRLLPQPCPTKKPVKSHQRRTVTFVKRISPSLDSLLLDAVVHDTHHFGITCCHLTKYRSVQATVVIVALQSWLLKPLQSLPRPYEDNHTAASSSLPLCAHRWTPSPISPCWFPGRPLAPSPPWSPCLQQSRLSRTGPHWPPARDRRPAAVTAERRSVSALPPTPSARGSEGSERGQRGFRGQRGVTEGSQGSKRVREGSEWSRESERG